MSNAVLAAVTIVFLAAHIAALLVAILLRPRGAAAISAVNIAVALILLAALAVSLTTHPVDAQQLGLIAFEVLALALAIAALRRLPLAFPASCAVFALHALASAAAVVFALTFKITRLF